MHVPASARRCVIFIGEVDNGNFLPRATGFLVVTGEKSSDDHFPYLVTAEHVVEGMTHAGKEIFVRFNLKDGTARFESTKGAKWWYHPTDWEKSDVVITAVGFDWNIVDHECIPLFNYDLHENTPILRPERQIGLGDETFAIGLFRSHHGAQRNRPIVRIGNIAAMPEEPIKTKYNKFVEGYLVEMRSIAGLSGSPVFVDRPAVPPMGFFPDPQFKPDPEQVNWFRYHFLGLIHGHFDVPNPLEDIVAEDDSATAGVNTGMGIVIPAQMILDTLYQDDLAQERIELLKNYKTAAAIPDENS